jgi:hypothetical protein
VLGISGEMGIGNVDGNMVVGETSMCIMHALYLFPVLRDFFNPAASGLLY